MKKLIIISLFAFLLSACNIQVLDTTWKYDYAYINVGDETIKCEVDSWKDYSESDMLQVRCKDGRSFLGHAASIILQSGE